MSVSLSRTTQYLDWFTLHNYPYKDSNLEFFVRGEVVSPLAYRGINGCYRRTCTFTLILMRDTLPYLSYVALLVRRVGVEPTEHPV